MSEEALATDQATPEATSEKLGRDRGLVEAANLCSARERWHQERAHDSIEHHAMAVECHTLAELIANQMRVDS